jgi:tripartite-type tricarboxylate transporter receptor subunit TctC
MHRMFWALASLFVVVASASMSFAQTGGWPSRPVKFIVPFAAGGPSDGVSRHIATRLEKVLGQPIVIENVAGQGGGIGVSRIARAEPDGYTIGLVHVGTQAINPAIYSSLNYDPLNDFASIARIYEYTNVLVINAGKPYKSLADLIKAAQDRPGTITYGSAGIGSSNHLSGEMLANVIGAKLIHVPYRGSAPAMNDLVAGNIDFMFDVLLTSKPFIDGGQLRALAVTSRERMVQLPNVPMMSETLPGFDVVGWVGTVAPKGVPAPIIARLTSEIEKILQEKETLDRFSAWGFDTKYGNPDQLTEAVRKDLALWGPIVKAAGVRLDQ